ncbi:MAG: hypothetical protein WCT24_03005 [Patescibacteria group bacterium]
MNVELRGERTQKIFDRATKRPKKTIERRGVLQEMSVSDRGVATKMLPKAMEQGEFEAHFGDAAKNRLLTESAYRQMLEEMYDDQGLDRNDDQIENELGRWRIERAEREKEAGVLEMDPNEYRAYLGEQLGEDLVKSEHGLVSQNVLDWRERQKDSQRAPEIVERGMGEVSEYQEKPLYFLNEKGNLQVLKIDEENSEESATVETLETPAELEKRLRKSLAMLRTISPEARTQREKAIEEQVAQRQEEYERHLPEAATEPLYSQAEYVKNVLVNEDGLPFTAGDAQIALRAWEQRRDAREARDGVLSMSPTEYRQYLEGILPKDVVESRAKLLDKNVKEWSARRKVGAESRAIEEKKKKMAQAQVEREEDEASQKRAMAHLEDVNAEMSLQEASSRELTHEISDEDQALAATEAGYRALLTSELSPLELKDEQTMEEINEMVANWKNQRTDREVADHVYDLTPSAYEDYLKKKLGASFDYLEDEVNANIVDWNQRKAKLKLMERAIQKKAQVRTTTRKAKEEAETAARAAEETAMEQQRRRENISSADKELVATESTYREMLFSQLSPEEKRDASKQTEIMELVANWNRDRAQREEEDGVLEMDANGYRDYLKGKLGESFDVMQSEVSNNIVDWSRRKGIATEQARQNQIAKARELVAAQEALEIEKAKRAREDRAEERRLLAETKKAMAQTEQAEVDESNSYESLMLKNEMARNATTERAREANAEVQDATPLTWAEYQEVLAEVQTDPATASMLADEFPKDHKGYLNLVTDTRRIAREVNAQQAKYDMIKGQGLRGAWRELFASRELMVAKKELKDLKKSLFANQVILNEIGKTAELISLQRPAGPVDAETERVRQAGADKMYKRRMAKREITDKRGLTR